MAAEDRHWPHGDPRAEKVLMRPVPHKSGEGAIYSIEYLIKREGNAYGTQPYTYKIMSAN